MANQPPKVVPARPARLDPRAGEPGLASGPVDEGLGAHPESRALHYNLACLEAIGGRRKEALTALRKAIELSPDVADWARQDEDLESLRDDPDFRALVER